MKDLNEELSELRKEFGTNDFDEHIVRIKEIYTTPEEKNRLVNFVLEMADTCESELQDICMQPLVNL